MNDEPMLRIASKTDSVRVMAERLERRGRAIYADEFRERIKSRQHRYFFLGWCAGLLTALVLVLAVKAEACGDLPAPDTTIEWIKVRGI